jgi:hypothetical protein
MGDLKAYRVFVGKPDGRRLLGMPMHREENNIKRDFRVYG